MSPIGCDGQGKKRPLERCLQRWKRVVLNLAAAAISTVVLVMQGSPAAGAAAAVNEVEATPNALVEAVLSGIRSNYSHIETIKAEIEEISEDASVHESETKSIDLPTGGRFTWLAAPRVTWKSTLYLQGDKVRRDTIRGEQGPVESILFDGDAWTQHVPDSRTAWIRAPEQMPSLFPIDLREAGSPSARQSLAVLLAEHQVISARTHTNVSGKTEIEVITAGPSEHQEFQFDAATNFLPTSRLTRHEDGTIRALEQLSYQAVLDGRAWLLEDRTLCFFDQGVTRAPLDRGWRQRLKLKVTSLTVNETIPKGIFSIQLPEGTHVRDSTSLGSPPRHSSDHARLRIVIAVLSVALALVVIVLALRRRFRLWTNII